MRFHFTRIKTILSLVIGFCAVQLSAQQFNTMTITEPASIAGTYTIVTGGFGLMDETTPITGSFAVGVDDNAPEGDACTPLLNDLTGMIGLVDRGACEDGLPDANSQFSSKVLMAQNAGAIAVIVCNNVPGDPVGMAAGDQGDAVTVYNAMVSLADCNAIKAVLEKDEVTGTFSFELPPCDAVYDSTVVWGANGEGAFAGGIGDWITVGTTDETHIFVHDAEGLNRGAIRNQNYQIASPTLCNGAMLMDFDFFTTGGDGDVLNGLVDLPTYSGALISPTMDLSTAEFPSCEFHQFLVPLNGNVSFSYSIDDGATWAEEQIVPTWNTLTYSTDDVRGSEVITMQMSDAAFQENVRVRFSANGADFYFWLIDDVVVKSFRKADVRANQNFYAIAPNYKTPINQVQEMAFLIDVENTGNVDIENVNVNATIVDESGSEIYSTDLEYNTIAAGFLDENKVFADTWVPTNEIGTYTGTYTVTSDNDEDLTNNTQSFTYEITQEDYAKVQSEAEVGFEYLSDRGIPNQHYYSYGNYYYVPNGDGLHALQVSLGISIADIPNSSGFITFAFYQWDDSNGDMMSQEDERVELYKRDIFITDDLTAADLRDMTINLRDEDIKLGDDRHYLAVAHMRPLSTSGSSYRVVAANADVQPEFNYAAMTLGLRDGHMINTYSSMSGQAAGESVEDAEATVLGANGFWAVYMPLKIGILTDVEEVNNDLNIKIFPNPAIDKLVVDLILDNNSETVGLQLTTIDGRVLLSDKAYNVKSDQIDLDISEIPSGVYMLNITTDDGYTSKKVVVSK